MTFAPFEPLTKRSASHTSISYGMPSLDQIEHDQKMRELQNQQEMEALQNGTAGGSGQSSSSGMMSAEDLLKAYQDGVAAGGVDGSGRSLEEMEAIHQMDLERMQAEQNLQLQGQKEVMDQTREARAAEKEQDFQYDTRRSQREANTAMSAYRNL